MEVKKKIAVWCALFALLVALVPPCNARAEDIDSDTLNAIKLLVDNEVTSALLSSKYYLIGYDESGDFLTVCFYDKENVVCIKGDTLNAPYVYLSTSYSNWNKATGEKYVFNNGNWEYYSKGSVSIAGKTYPTLPPIFCSSFSEIYDYYGKVIVTDIPAIEDLLTYNFVMWCTDAGLNCQASSNESDSVIPYSYNDYWHIVRKTSSGKWLLTTIGSTLGQAKMSLRLSEDLGKLKIYEYSGDDSFIISVRQYEYDTDGWKLRSYGSYGYDDFTSGIVELPTGTGINSSVGLAYTSTDIYTSDGLAVYSSASAEYTEPFFPDVVPPFTEEPTPTVTPSIGVQNQTLYMYSVEYIGSVVSANASLYEVCNGVDDDILVDLLKGMRVKVHGWTTDSSGDMWYYCTYTNIYEGEVTGEFTGFIKSNSIGLTYSSGDTDEEQDMTLREQLQVISSFVLSVPMIISALFSFMPPWSLTLVGIAFSIAAILMLRKG